MRIISPVAVGLAVMCVFLGSVPSYAEPIHLELGVDHEEVLYLSEEEVESLISDGLLESVVLSETADPEMVLALGSGAVMVGVAVLPGALNKVFSVVRFLGGSGGKKMVLVLGLASATLARSFLKMQGEEGFLEGADLEDAELNKKADERLQDLEDAVDAELNKKADERLHDGSEPIRVGITELA